MIGVQRDAIGDKAIDELDDDELSGRGMTHHGIDDVEGIGLHPSLAGFKELMDEGVASIVQGVGYPNPNRSHFTSMDVWHTARTDAQGNGWLGRYFDHTCAGTPEPEAGIAIGREAPLAMTGQVQKPVRGKMRERREWNHGYHKGGYNAWITQQG